MYPKLTRMVWSAVLGRSLHRELLTPVILRSLATVPFNQL